MIRKAHIAACIVMLACVSSASPLIMGVSRNASRVSRPAVESPAPSASYRTVAVFGDTQFAVQAGQTSKLASFNAQVDWVIANKVAENIDFVLHVGDIINEGSFLPTTSNCDSGIDAPLGTCLGWIGDTVSCNAEPGCYVPIGTTDCWTCGAVDTVAAEWVTFDSVWSKFDPGAVGGLPGGVPYAIVRGNHDNVGVAVQTERDTPGYNQLYGAAFWESLEASFNAAGTTYNHVSTNASFGTEGEANVWRLPIGGVETLIVGPSYEGGGNISQPQIDWVVSTFNSAPTTPGVLLVHDTQQNGAIRTQTWDPITGEPPVPSIFWSAAGHIGNFANFKNLVTNGSEIVLRTVTDWSRTNDPTPNDYLMLARFYLEPEDPDELEAFDYSPQRDVNDPTAGNTIARAAFDMMPAVPYDLSAHEVAIAAAFDATGSDRPAWPNPPSINAANNVSISTDDCATLATAIDTAQTHISITTAGTLIVNCSSAQMSFGADDVWLEMDDGVSIVVADDGGDVTAFGRSRLKITGGRIAISGLSSEFNLNDIDLSGVTDLLVKNVKIESLDGSFKAAGTTRAAIISNTIVSGRYAMQFLGTASVDTHILNNDMLGGEGGTESTLRMQNATRVIQADNRIDNVNGYNLLWRAWANQQNILLVNNVSISRGSEFSTPLWIGSNYNTPAPGCGGQPGDLYDIFVIGNSLFNTSLGNNAITAGYDIEAGCPSRVCASLTIDGNTLYTDNASPAFTVITGGHDAACTNVTNTNNNAAALATSFPGGVPPTCVVLGCGADH